MADMSKMRTILFVVLLVVALGLAAGVFALLQQERVKSAGIQAQLDDVTAKQEQTLKRLDESKQLITTLEGKLQQSQQAIESLNGDLKKEKMAKEDYLAQVELLTADLKSQKQLRDELETKLTKAQDDLKQNQGKLKELDAKKAELEEKIKTLEEAGQTAVQPESVGVELGKIVVGADNVSAGTTTMPETEQVASAAQAPVSQGALEGKVLVVNKDYNFAVINLGSKDGVEVGAVFSVYRDATYLGDIKVEKVHESMSAAGFASLEVKSAVTEGDRAVLKTK